MGGWDGAGGRGVETDGGVGISKLSFILVMNEKRKIDIILKNTNHKSYLRPQSIQYCCDVKCVWLPSLMVHLQAIT